MDITGLIDITSDSHGNNKKIHEWIKNSQSTTLIHCGDDGSGFVGYDNENVKLGEALNRAGKRLLVIRGNHNDPEYFDNRIYGGEYGGIHLLKDGTILKWNNQKILFNGGGLSLDRSSRAEWIDYWSGEKFKFVEVKEQIDHLITHISLTQVQSHSINASFVTGWASRDPKLIDDLNIEQRDLQNWIDYLIENGSKIKTWHYGHYHTSIVSEYRGIQCRCLAINEIRPFCRQY